MRVPNVYFVDNLDFDSWPRTHFRGRWFRARPMGLDGPFLRYRLRVAWLVFTGRWDAVRWGGGQ